MWSLGVVLFAMCTGTYGNFDINQFLVHFNRTSQLYTPPHTHTHTRALCGLPSLVPMLLGWRLALAIRCDAPSTEI